MSSQIRTISLVASSLLAGSLLFTGCGGGGGGNPETVIQTQSTTVGGTVVDGYLKNAVVWLDLDGDEILDSGEPSDTTDEEGNYDLKITESVKAHPGFTSAKIVSKGGVDVDTGELFVGKYLAPFTGETKVSVTALTTLVAKLAEKEGGDVESAEEKVKKALGLPPEADLYEDPKKLEKEGDKALIAATLSVQKSVEAIVQSAAGNDERKAAELQDKLLSAFAESLKNDDNATGVESMLEAVKNSELADEIDAAEIQKAKEVARAVEEAVETHDSEDVERAMVVYMNQSGESDTSLNDLLSDPNQLTLQFMTTKLQELGIEEAQTLAQQLIQEGFEADDLTNPSEETKEKLRNDERFREVYAALVRLEQQVEEQADETAAEGLGYAVKLQPGYSFHELELEEIDGTEVPAFYTHTLESDGTVSESVEIFVNGAWVQGDPTQDSDLVLTSEGWKKESETMRYEINADGSVTINESFKIGIVKEKDISGTYTVAIDGQVLEATMPAGSVRYTNSFERIADEYYLWEKERTHGNIPDQEYYTSFEQLIQSQCGFHWFDGDEHGGVSFAGTFNETTQQYECDGSATHGTLFAVQGGDETTPATIVSQNAGEWEIKEVHGQKILFVRPAQEYRHDEDEETIFAEYDGAVWRGAVEKADQQDIWYSYNDTAAEALKSAIENLANANVGEEGDEGDDDGTVDEGNQTAVTPLNFTPMTLGYADLAGKKVLVDTGSEQIVVKFYKNGGYEEEGQSKDGNDSWQSIGSWTTVGNYLLIDGTEKSQSGEGGDSWLTLVAFDGNLSRIVRFDDEGAGRATATSIQEMDSTEDATQALNFTPLAIGYDDIAGKRFTVEEDEENITLEFFKDGTYKEHGINSGDNEEWFDEGSWTILDDHIVINAHEAGNIDAKDHVFSIVFNGDLQHAVYFADEESGQATLAVEAMSDDTTQAPDFTPASLSWNDLAGKKRIVVLDNNTTITFYYHTDGRWVKEINGQVVATGSWTVVAGRLVIQSDAYGLAIAALTQDLSSGLLYTSHGVATIPNSSLTNID
ncbi:hypothetical protein [Hydrogenimonas sp.]